MGHQSSMDELFLITINQIIEENLDNEKFSVEELAQKAGLSRSMLHRKLVKFTGKSASDLITITRLTKAKELLENDVATASEIAYQVGFSSPSYFTKVFKNYFQLSPGEIRRGASYSSSSESTTEHAQKFYRKKMSYRRLIILLTLILLVIISSGTIYYLTFNKSSFKKSIAILPFDNLSSYKENQYFADGIVEDLLNRLSSIKELIVISRTSSEMFRNKGNKTIPEIAELLGVNYVLEGSIQRQAENVRINIQLIDANSDNHILSKQYNQKISDIFEIQSEIANRIISELSLVLTDEQEKTLIHNQTINLKAFEYGQLGRYHLNRRTKEDLFASVAYFRMAINEDPNYALAYANLAESYYILPWWGHLSKQRGRDSAIYFVRKALELDSQIGEAHAILGGVYDQFDWNYGEASKEFLQAIELNPNYAPTYQYYSELLRSQWKIKEAREVLNKAIELNPYSYMLHMSSFLLYYNEENYQQALREVQFANELVKDNPDAAWIKFKLYYYLKDDSLAIVNYKKYGGLLHLWTPKEVDSVYYIKGSNGLLSFYLSRAKFKREIDKATAYAMAGRDDEALTILESGVKDHTLRPYATVRPEFKKYYHNPRFIAVRKKMGLPPIK
jgi:TolB-like protein/AraC-like DNA-binding protein/Tfp pilus assembly protein PilF